MVIDAQVVLTVSQIVVPPIVQPPAQQELLYPPRHQITLPLNNLNFIFDNIEVAFNQTSKLNFFFRNYFLDWDGLGYISALEQNFNPSVQDIKRRTDLGK
jgi:hypothetical protein